MLQDSSFADVLPVPTPSHLTKDLASRAVSEFAELFPPQLHFHLEMRPSVTWYWGATTIHVTQILK